jgi:hypothetical protein
MLRVVDVLPAKGDDDEPVLVVKLPKATREDVEHEDAAEVARGEVVHDHGFPDEHPALPLVTAVGDELDDGRDDEADQAEVTTAREVRGRITRPLNSVPFSVATD